MNYDKMPKAVQHLWLTMVLLSRVPMPHLPPSAFESNGRAVWAYPLVGTMLAALSLGLGLIGLRVGAGPEIAAGITLASMAFLTGAMHEDGLADVADGFWGGSTPERRLEIMKDSQIGTYGVLALIFSVGLRWTAVTVVLVQAPFALIATAAMSRAGMPILMHLLPHARNTGLSHSVGKPSAPTVLLGLTLGLLIGVLCMGGIAGYILLTAFASTAFVGWIARQKIRGQTGDVLGASQVVCETAALVGLTCMLA